jgi:sec-independent protein translocase protein TatA
MPNLGPTELILILVIVMIIFGPGKLAGLGSSLGKSIREFRKATTDPDQEEEGAEAQTAAEAKPTGEAKTTVEEPKSTRPPTVTVAEEKPAPVESSNQSNKAS